MSASQSREFGLLVIGGGPAGMAGARFARSRDASMTVGMIRAQQRSLTPCSIPYALSGLIPIEGLLKSDEKMLSSVGIELTVDEATTIDTARKRVSTAASGEFGYDKLLIATGARPIVPPIPGVDLPGVFAVRDLPDLIQIQEAMGSAKRAAVIGGGYIGLEIAMAFHGAGIETHVIEMLSFCLGNVCSEQIATQALEEVIRGGLHMHTGQMAQAIEGDETVTAVRTNVETIPADLVVLAVGVRGQTALAAEAGIEVTRLGIPVNDRMETSAPDVWAAGDCVEHRHFITGAVGVGQLATTAVVQGKTAAINMTGGQRLFPGYVMASVTRLFERSYGSTGLNRLQATNAGFDVVEGEVTGASAYEGYPNAEKCQCTLIFDKQSGALIGAECNGGKEVAPRVDMLTMAIMQRMTMEQLASLQYPAHPLHTDIPGHPPIVSAAENAMRKANLL
ncbi:MAG: FAD-dependent oxidoreductase [Armatimonadetes bacterium]|nr:FAD-dependent oxidoreductase [Armatimonadota bacterium]